MITDYSFSSQGRRRKASTDGRHGFARRRTGVTAAALAISTSLVLAGCQGASAQNGDDALKVVATTTQLTDFAHRIGGDDIELTGLLPAGGSAHHFDPTPADLMALGEADVFIVNGVGLETFVDDAIEASGFEGELVTASDGIDLGEAEEITSEAEESSGDHDHDHNHDGDHDHDEDDHGDDHDHDEHDHDHGPVNPHIWTSPEFAAGMAAEVARGLAAADPERAADFESRAEAYEAELRALGEWIEGEFDQVPAAERVLVSGHDSLRYFLHDYDIEFAGSILPSFEDNAEPSAADIEELAQTIQDRGITAIFVESSMNPRLAETIANEAGVEVVGEDALYADSLGEEGSGAETFIDATTHNTHVILQSWGYEPGPLPEQLQ